MKINVKRKIVTFLGALVCLFLILHPFLSAGTTYRNSLENYSGRIVSLEEIQNINANLLVWRPIGEAQVWGKDAILGYDDNHLHILRPDPITPGLFQHAEIDTTRFGYEDM